MTPPDQSDEQPSALSRLERALAGFGEPARTEAPPEPESEDEPEVEPEDDEEFGAESDEAPESADDVDGWEESEPVQASSFLDVASAVEAVERLSAAGGDEPHSERLSGADEFVLATTAASTESEFDPDDLPRFERAERRNRGKERAAQDEGDDAPEPAGFDEPPVLSRISDSADSWQRNAGDQQLPYFLVEDNVPLGAEPTPTLEELRQTKIERKPSGSIVRTLAEIPILLIVAALIAFLVKTFLAQAYYIPSGSMLPQLQIDDRVVVSKLAYKAHDPNRGDIVVFDDPRTGAAANEPDDGILRKIGEGIGIVQPSTDEFIKRVIGLPGDTVEGKNGHVYVNGHLLLEPYLTEDVVTSDFPKTTVARGRLWVMGDNRSGSADSRVFGQIKIDTIVGHAMVTVWPFDHIQFL